MAAFGFAMSSTLSNKDGLGGRYMAVYRSPSGRRRPSGDNEAILDFRGLSKVQLKNDNVQAFDAKWDEKVTEKVAMTEVLKAHQNLLVNSWTSNRLPCINFKKEVDRKGNSRMFQIHIQRIDMSSSNLVPRAMFLHLLYLRRKRENSLWTWELRFIC